MSESPSLVLNDEIVVFRVDTYRLLMMMWETQERPQLGGPCPFMQELSGVGENLKHCSCFQVAGLWCEKRTPQHLVYLLFGYGGFRDDWWSSTGLGLQKVIKGASVRDQESRSWGQHIAHTDQMGPFILIHTRSSAVKAATIGFWGLPSTLATTRGCFWLFGS